MAEGVVAGIDWASEVHVACVMDGDGAVTGRFSFTHDARGDQGDGPAAARGGRGRGGDRARVTARWSRSCWRPGWRCSWCRAGRSRACGPGTGRRETRTTGSMPMCWRTRCGPTGTGGSRCGPTPRRPGRCGRCAGPARTWSRPGSRCWRSCARTWTWRSPARSACSPSLPARSAWRSCAGSRPRPRPRGCPRPASPRGCGQPAIPAASPPRCCTPG